MPGNQSPAPNHPPRARLCRGAVPLPSGSIVEDEGNLHIHLVFGDLIVVDRDAHLLDPGALDVAQGLGGAVDPLMDGILEALVGRGTQLSDLGDGHGSPLSGSKVSEERSNATLSAPMATCHRLQGYPRT